MKPLHQTLIEELQNEIVCEGCYLADYSPCSCIYLHKKIAQTVTKTLERVRGEIEGIPMIWTYRSPELIPKSKALATLTTNKEEEQDAPAIFKKVTDSLEKKTSFGEKEIENSDAYKNLRQIRNMQIDSQRMTLNKQFDSKEEEPKEGEPIGSECSCSDSYAGCTGECKEFLKK